MPAVEEMLITSGDPAKLADALVKLVALEVPPTALLPAPTPWSRSSQGEHAARPGPRDRHPREPVPAVRPEDHCRISKSDTATECQGELGCLGRQLNTPTPEIFWKSTVHTHTH